MITNKAIRQAFQSAGYPVRFNKDSGMYFITSAYVFPDLRSMYHFYFG